MRSFGAKRVDKGTIHGRTAAYPAGNPPCILQGPPYTLTSNTPTFLRPSVLARCAIRKSFLRRSSHCPVDSDISVLELSLSHHGILFYRFYIYIYIFVSWAGRPFPPDDGSWLPPLRASGTILYSNKDSIDIVRISFNI